MKTTKLSILVLFAVLTLSRASATGEFVHINDYNDSTNVGVGSTTLEQQQVNTDWDLQEFLQDNKEKK